MSSVIRLARLNSLTALAKQIIACATTGDVRSLLSIPSLSEAVLVTGVQSVAGAKTFTDALTITKVPTGTTPSTSTLVVNPASADANADLIWAGVGDSAVFQVDEDGDVYVKSKIGVNCTATFPLELYSSTTGHMYFDSNQAATGEIPAGCSFGGHHGGVAWLGDATGGTTTKQVIAAYTSGGWKSVLETQNTSGATPILSLVRSVGLVGIGTTAPIRALDINEASGNCLRLIYNDADGSAANYTDFLVSSSGDLTITPSGGDLTVTGHTHLTADSRKLYLGGGDDASVYYDGTSAYIKTDEVAASDLHITTGSQKTLVLDTVVYDDLRITPGSFDRPGSSDPVYVAYTPGGSGIVTYLTEWALNNVASCTVQLPHTYKEGTDISVHIHWTPGARGTAESGKYVGWKAHYCWANIDGTFSSMQTADLSDVCDGTNHKHQMTPSVTIDGHTAAKGISSMLIMNITRTDTGADDDWAGNTTGNLPLLLELDLHYAIDTCGSRQIGTK